MTKTLILNGDGYLGWPTAMHLTARGHEVAVADNYLLDHRRKHGRRGAVSVFQL